MFRLHFGLNLLLRDPYADYADLDLDYGAEFDEEEWLRSWQEQRYEAGNPHISIKWHVRSTTEASDQKVGRGPRPVRTF